MKLPNAIDESTLLHLLRAGDELALKLLFEQFHGALVFFANRMLSTYHDQLAEEVVQDSFLKVYERRTTFATLDSIKAFLYISTKNACLNVIRKEQVRQRSFDSFIAGYDDVEHAVINQMINAEVVHELHQAIGELPEQCRRIIQLLIEEDRSPKEIAQQLGIQVSTVNSQKARAIALLKKRLSDAGILLLIQIL